MSVLTPLVIAPQQIAGISEFNNHQVFIVEQGIYIQKRYGLRIENTIVIKSNKLRH